MTKTALMTALALATLGGLAFAQPPGRSPGGPPPDPGAASGPQHGRHHGFNPRRVAHYLDLTEAQVEQMQALLEEQRARVEPQREESRALRDELRTLVQSTTPDPCAIGQVVLDLDASREALRSSWEVFDADFTVLLTPKQQEKWEQLKRLVRFFGPRGGGPGGPEGLG